MSTDGVPPRPSEPDAAGPDEELLANPRPWSRTLRFSLVGLAACLAAGIVLALVNRGTDKPARVASPTTSGAPAAVATARTTPAPSSAAVLAGAPMLDVLTVGDRTWVLQPHYLSMVDDLTVVARTATIDADLQTPGAQARLTLDPDGSTLWVVLEGARHGTVLTYDAFTLARRSSMQFPDISSAAVLGGHLYLVSDGTLVDVPPTGGPRLVEDTPSGLVGVAADPTRSRLLLIDDASPANVWTYQPGTNQAQSTSHLALPITKGSIAVVHGTIWVGGYGKDAPMLVRLNAAASTTTTTSPLTKILHAGALIVATGQHVVWVRDGGGSNDLWCVDADTGAVAQHWNIPGPVTSVTGTAIVGSDRRLVPLHLTGCAG